MTLRFSWTWEPAPDVRLPEHAATWSRLGIDLDNTPATLVERRDGSGGPRRLLDVPTYPLAEWLAVNWWQLSATSHLPSDTGIRFVDAGNGFAWPDLTLRSDRGLLWASLRQRDKAPEHVRFLTQAETVLDADKVLGNIADFIDATVRQLDDADVSGTLLQDEWLTVQEADKEERDYCLVTAAWGQDPYDTPADFEALLTQSDLVDDARLLADLARAVPLADVIKATEWLRDATATLEPHRVDLPSVGPLDWSSTAGIAPWKIGYERARRLRNLLDLDPINRTPIQDLLAVRQTATHAPLNVDALISAGPSSTLAVVVGAGTSPRAQRFASARAVARQSLAPTTGPSLLTRASRYTERTERAFAAELLAPADGIVAILHGDFSDDALQRAARHFDVNVVLIQHQVENQVAA